MARGYPEVDGDGPAVHPAIYVRFHRSIKSGTLALTETPKNQDTAQSFQRTLQVGHCLIASGPADLSVGFCTVAIVTPGSVYSPYVCETFGTLNETDIEHIVARSEAHDSGLCAASPERKRQFAGDMRNLTLSAPDLNRNVKRAQDAADWTPDENRCWFAWRVIDVRRAYGLTIDHREAAALDALLAACPESSPDTQPACLNIPKERSAK